MKLKMKIWEATLDGEKQHENSRKKSELIFNKELYVKAINIWYCI